MHWPWCWPSVPAARRRWPSAAASAATAPPTPTASLTANPNTISAGQASTLTWTTNYATDVTIDQLGKVDPSGSRSVTPTESTTYHLVAKNDSGTQEATARITVTQAAPPPPQQTSNDSDAQLFSSNMKDVFFDYDSYDISTPVSAGTAGGCAFSAAAPGHEVHHRRPLRRTRFDRVQPGARRQSCQFGQAGLGATRHSLPTVSAPSATARKSRSARRATSRAGSRTAGRTLSIRSSGRVATTGAWSIRIDLELKEHGFRGSVGSFAGWCGAGITRSWMTARLKPRPVESPLSTGVPFSPAKTQEQEQYYATSN